MDHDRLFKELLTTFFLEFMELFFPEMAEYVDRDSLEFLDKELFTDVTQGTPHEVDLVVKARFREQSAFFVIHVENQAQAQGDFARRMFCYFARLHEKHGLPVYPVALFSYDQPQRAEPDEYRVEFPDFEVLSFRFRVVQLNRLDWQDFAERMNPISAALMAKMIKEPTDRPRVKAACLKLLTKFELDPARCELISGFIDAYLRLTIDEEQAFQAELKNIEPEQRERVMEIVTSWMEKGIEQGIEKGIEQGMEQGIEQGVRLGKQDEARSLVLRMLSKRFGPLEPQTEARIVELPVEQLETLAEALLDFSASSDLTGWLDAHAGK